jgi:hypothetical protein
LYVSLRDLKPRIELSAPTNVNQSAGGLANPHNWYLRSVMDHLEDSEGTQWSFRGDGEYDLNTNWLDSIKFGARYADRDQDQSASHRRRAGLGQMGLRAVLPHGLADFQRSQTPDYEGSCRQADQHRGSRSEHRA